jgi:hypothetical protein
VKRFLITVVWRGFRWNLSGRAKHPVDLVTGINAEFGPGACIRVALA